MTGRRRDGTNPRALGTNTRALRTNPRALAANPTVGAEHDRREFHRMVNRALVRIHRAGGWWCEQCEDSGFIEVDRVAVRCPDHRSITYREAQAVMRANFTELQKDGST